MPPASSTTASLAQRTAPAASRLLPKVASSSKRWSFSGAAPQEVGMPPDVASRSLAPYGMPSSGPRSRPAATSRSAPRARRLAGRRRRGGGPEAVGRGGAAAGQRQGGPGGRARGRRAPADPSPEGAKRDED